jgi:putative flavoprotein involved in K+ transport
MPRRKPAAYFQFMIEQVETIIVGGGQAGLAVGYQLTRLERQFVILDAHQRTGDSWRTRWDSLQLFTPAHLNALPGLAFPGPQDRCSTKDEMADYLEAYAARFDLPVRRGIQVEAITRNADRLVIIADDQRFEADNVVLATGGYQLPYRPGFADELDAGILQLHSSEYRTPSQLQDGDVLVVGAANSGADIALEASATHRTWLSGRHPGSEPTRPGSRVDRIFTPPFWFYISRVASVTNPIGRRLRPRMLTMTLPLGRVKPKDLEAAGVVRLPRAAGVRDGRPVMDDGQVVDVANLVWATGYRPGFTRFTSTSLIQRDSPSTTVGSPPSLASTSSGCSFSARLHHHWSAASDAMLSTSLDIYSWPHHVRPLTREFDSLTATVGNARGVANLGPGPCVVPGG